MITGLAHGCFDVLHFGHVAHLQAARQLCDWLVVCVTPDEYVNKGPHRPVFTAEQRRQVLFALSCVDEVFVGDGPEVGINALALIKPRRFFKGQEYEASDHPGFRRERLFCEANGIEVMFTHEPVFSTTLALQRLAAAARAENPA
jgi:cytidyltransferase-like protein